MKMLSPNRCNCNTDVCVTLATKPLIEIGHRSYLPTDQKKKHTAEERRLVEGEVDNGFKEELLVFWSFGL